MTDIRHLQVGILADNLEARNYLSNGFGKKSMSSDITLYGMASNGTILTTILPEAYPKKPISLVLTAHMSDLVVLGASVNGINADVGEAAILADTLNLDGFKAVIGDQATGYDSYLNQMDKVFSKLNVSKWENKMIASGKAIAEVRDELINKYTHPRGNPEDPLVIETDHAFPVQGVGSVVLATIVSGTVKKGQKIKIHPEGVVGTVRSIQVNDENVHEAGPGVHVGLAMRGILPKYLNRGTIITSPEEDYVREIKFLDSINIKAAAFGQKPEVGDRVHVVSGLYSAPATITKWNNSVSLELDRSIPFYDKIRLTILDLNKKPAILGSYTN